MLAIDLLAQVRWEAIAGGVGVVAVFFGGFIMNGMTNRLNHHGKTLDQHSESITRLETQFEHIDAKLDTIIQRGG